MKPVELLRKIDKVGVYRFTGSIDAGGVPIHVEVITGYRFGRPTFAVGFSFDSESFGALSEKLSGIGVDFLDAIGLELQVSLVRITMFRISYNSYQRFLEIFRQFEYFTRFDAPRVTESLGVCSRLS